MLNEIISIIGLLATLAGVFVSIKMSYRKIRFTLNHDCKERIFHRCSGKYFSGITDIEFIIINDGAKKIIIEKIIIEKRINYLCIAKDINKIKKTDLEENFFSLYHFFVSEETLLSEDEISYERTDSLYTRKYNLLKNNIHLDCPDKFIFTWKAEDYFRHMYYFFDEKVCFFTIENIYAIDTTGKKYSLNRSDIAFLKKCSVVDGESIFFLVNQINYDEKLKLIFLYHISRLYKRSYIDNKNISFVSMAFSRFFKIKEGDFKDGLESIFDKDMIIDNDENSIEKSMKPPVEKNKLYELSDNLGDFATLSTCRDYITSITKKFQNETLNSLNKIIEMSGNILGIFYFALSHKKRIHDLGEYIWRNSIAHKINELKKTIEENSILHGKGYSQGTYFVWSNEIDGFTQLYDRTDKNHVKLLLKIFKKQFNMIKNLKVSIEKIRNFLRDKK